MARRAPVVIGVVVGVVGVVGALAWALWPAPPPEEPALTEAERSRQETEDHMRAIGYVQ